MGTSNLSVPNVDTTFRIAKADEQTLVDYLLFRRHRLAYEVAARTVRRNDTVVDIGCGLGYGLELFAAQAAEIVAIDLSQAALDQLPHIPSLRRVRANAADLPLEPASVDVLVAFQLIEHVPRGTAVAVLMEIQRVLREGGVAFVTTPNRRWRLLPDQRPWNPYHYEEYGPQEIVDLCADAGIARKQIFGVVGLHGAQEVERWRVRQRPMKVWGRTPRAALYSAWNVIEQLPWKLFGTRPTRSVNDGDRERDWFHVSPRFADGLDFLIRIGNR